MRCGVPRTETSRRGTCFPPRGWVLVDWESAGERGPALPRSLSFPRAVACVARPADLPRAAGGVPGRTRWIAGLIRSLRGRIGIPSDDAPAFLKASPELDDSADARSHAERIARSGIDVGGSRPRSGIERARPRVRVRVRASGGSEPGAGWAFARMLASRADVWVVTRANNRGAIEAGLENLPERDRLHFVYVDLLPGLGSGSAAASVSSPTTCSGRSSRWARRGVSIGVKRSISRST